MRSAPILAFLLLALAGCTEPTPAGTSPTMDRSLDQFLPGAGDLPEGYVPLPGSPPDLLLREFRLVGTQGEAAGEAVLPLPRTAIGALYTDGGGVLAAVAAQFAAERELEAWLDGADCHVLQALVVDRTVLVLSWLPWMASGDDLPAHLAHPEASVAHVAEALAARHGMTPTCLDSDGNERDEEAINLAVGDNGPFRFEWSRDDDFYAFDVPQAGLVRLSVEGPPVFVHLRGPDGPTWRWWTVPGAVPGREDGLQHLVFDALQGAHVVKLSSAQAGSYTLTLAYPPPEHRYWDSDNSMAAANPLELGSNPVHALTPYFDVDWHSFTVARPAEVSVWLDADDDSHAVFDVRDATNTTLSGPHPVSEAGGFARTLPEGTYYIRAWSPESYRESYQVVLAMA